MASRNCRARGCRMVWCCVTGATPGDTTGTTGTERPIGLITTSSINTSESDGDSTGYMGGNVSDDQTAINFDANGFPDDTSRYLGDDGQYYDLCGSSGGCNDEISFTADFCLALKDGSCNNGNTNDAQVELVCQSIKHLRLKYINEFGQAIPIYDAPDTEINSKNRTFPGGTENATFDISATVEGGGRYLNCFH